MGNKAVSELKWRKRSPEKGSQVEQNVLNVMTKNITYLESNFCFTSSNYLCFLKPFKKEKVCHKVLKNDDHLDMLTYVVICRFKGPD